MFFSTDDGVTVRVGPEHATFAKGYLDSLYAKPSLAFDEYARMQKRRFQLAGGEDLDALFLRRPSAIRALMEQEQLTQSDIGEIFQFDERAQVRATATMLKDAGFLRRVGSSYYVKTPAGITWLRNELMSGRIVQMALQSPVNGNGNGHGSAQERTDALAASRLQSVRTETDESGEPEW
jgi:hypothetical protein